MFFFLRENYFESEKSFFIVQKLLFKMFGFWPGSDVIHPFQIGFAIYNTLEIAFHGIFQINFCIKNVDDLVLFLNGVTPLMSQLMLVEQVCVIIWKRKDVKIILDQLKDSIFGGKPEIA